MPLQDVSNDLSTIDWLRQSGHGHLLDEHSRYANIASPAPAPPPLGAISSPIHADQYHRSYDRSPSFTRVANFNTNSYDPEIENLKHDPNTQVIQRPPPDDVVYKQRVFMRYLQPPTPPVSGAIIVREKQLPPPPPEPPIVIKRAPPPPPTPPPVIIRERPPPIPPPEPTTIIDRIVPSTQRPPRQVIIEQYPQLPPKPRDIIVERWLPVPPRQRRILYERLPAPIVNPAPTGPIVIQHGQPNVLVHREVVNAPCQHSHTSSLISYDPTLGLNQTCTSTVISPANIVPTSYVCTSQGTTGLCSYGSGISAIPTSSCSSGHTAVYSVSETVPIDSILHQFGIDTCSIKPSTCTVTCPSKVTHCVTRTCC